MKQANVATFVAVATRDVEGTHGNCANADVGLEQIGGGKGTPNGRIAYNYSLLHSGLISRAYAVAPGHENDG